MPVIGFVVPMESAVIPGHAQISVYGNHRDMVRFLNYKVSDSEPGYNSIYQNWNDGRLPLYHFVSLFQSQRNKDLAKAVVSRF